MKGQVGKHCGNDDEKTGKRSRDPDMADLAVELWKSCKDSGAGLTTDAWRQISDMLSFAAEAQKKLERKEKRIKDASRMHQGS